MLLHKLSFKTLSTALIATCAVLMVSACGDDGHNPSLVSPPAATPTPASN